MSGGRRKSRKPQKWEDYVADEEQLASIEKELVKEEKARMKSASNDGDSSEKSPDNDQNEEGDVDVEGIDDNTTDEEVDLEISILKEEEKELQAEEELIKEQICEDDKGNKVEVQEEKPQSTISATDEHVIGDCTMCGIQLRNWASTHNHLRFHRLSHVPDCNYERLNCQVCQRSCQNREVLAYHIYTEHYIKCKEVKTCPFCCSNFKDLEEFQEHLDINVITFKCQVCGVLVNQEHKFYKHILYCAQHHQPGITSLQCCICGTRTSVTKFYMHLLQHSTMLNLPRHLAHNSIRRAVYAPKPDPPRQSRYRPFLCEICDRRFVVYSEFKRHLYSHFKSRSYICTHCGRSYCQKNTLIVHLYSYHNSSPNAEITPREDTTQRPCDLCGLSGFLNEEMLVRHCILRCAQRNNLQASFAAVVSSLAKKQNIGFTETLQSNAMQTYLKLGVEAWRSPLYVKQYLEKLQANNNPLVPSSGNRRDSGEFTDVQLLAYLDQFEALNRDKDKELELLLNIRSKGNRGNQMEILTFDDTPSSTQADLETQVSERETLGAEDPLWYSPGIGRKLVTSRNATSNNSQVDLSCLMQHLRKGSDKRSADEHGGEVGPIDICLVTSTTNTQVTITPAGCHQRDIRPPKVARSVSHKPSVAKIQSIYPGITVLSDVDFSRIPSIILEMQEMMSYRVQREMEEAAIIPEDLQRLEVEAQLLREAEPFYLQDDSQWQLPKCNGIFKRANKRCSIIPEPSVLSRIIAEASVFYNRSMEEKKHVLEYPNMNEDLKKIPGKIDVENLLTEAQNLIVA